MNFDDVGGLQAEPYDSTISGKRLREAGVNDDAIYFLRDQRVELNSMTSRQLVDFVERKLKENKICKVIPSATTLKTAYQMFARSDKLSDAFDEVRDKVDDEIKDRPIEVPKDLEAKVRASLKTHPHLSWHEAVRAIVDPKALSDNHDDEDLSDVGK